MAQLEEAFPEEFRHVFRHYPLIGTPENPFHDKAALSAQAAEAAGRQGQFWEMNDLLFSRQSEWAGMTVAAFEDWLVERAEEIELDVEQFTADMTSPELVDLAQSAWDRGQGIGIPGTPFVLVNGHAWPNNVPLDFWNLSAVIQLTMLEERQFSSCPPMAIDPLKQCVATLGTAKGDIVLELFAEEAPLAVNSFIFLAENGWFDGVTFHRVIPGFVAQAGDPTGTGFGGPGYAFDNEIAPELKFDRAGILGMANAGPGSNGSQFFITYAPTPNLDGSYTIFGQVIEGMDVLESLTSRDPSQNAALPPGDEIIKVTIEEK